jgi:hypothetical protein
MSQSAVESAYSTFGEILGFICGAAAFLIVYAAAISSVGWVIGLALGWVAAGIAASLAYLAGKHLWPLAVVAGLWLLAGSPG